MGWGGGGVVDGGVRYMERLADLIRSLTAALSLVHVFIHCAMRNCHVLTLALRISPGLSACHSVFWILSLVASRFSCSLAPRSHLAASGVSAPHASVQCAQKSASWGHISMYHWGEAPCFPLHRARGISCLSHGSPPNGSPPDGSPQPWGPPTSRHASQGFP